MIPYGRQQVTEADIDAVATVLRSDFLTQGPTVPRFETAVAARVGARHAVAVNSATSALHLACLALGLGPGDHLWTVPNTFVASANCARYCGAMVDFVDIDPDTWNMSVPDLERRLAKAAGHGNLPKVIVPVHFAGQATEQESIWSLARKYGCNVLEDASHSIGAARKGEPVGSCRWSQVTVFSFHPVKIITSGEGGMALTNDAELAERMRLLRSHGITRERQRLLTGSAPSWYYEQQELGFNYRLTEIHAALGLSQLQRLDDYVRRRNEIAAIYQSAFAGLPLRLPKTLVGNLSAFHLYVVRLKAPAIRHRAVFDELRRRGLGVNLHYMPVHLQPYYRKLGFDDGTYPEAESHGKEAITVPLFPGMQDSDVEEVIAAMHACVEELV